MTLLYSVIGDSTWGGKSMTLLHVVIGSEGEYSSREEYVAGVFTDLEVAKKHIMEKTAEGRQRETERLAWLDKQRLLLRAKKEEKIAALDAKVLSYYGKDYIPSNFYSLTPEDTDQLSDQLGPYPTYIECDNFYVVSVPLDEWGRWGGFDETI